MNFPFAENVALQMHPRFAELRSQPGLLRVKVPYGDDAWLVTAYEHARIVLTDPRFSREEAARHDEARLTPFPIRTSVLGMDPPRHTLVRQIFSRVFTQARVEGLQPSIVQIAEALVDELQAQGGPADMVDRFVMPFSSQVICELMGIPVIDRRQVRHWIDGFSSTSAMPPDEVQARMDALYVYVRELLGLRRAEPGEDLISALVKEWDGEPQLTEQELLEFITVLFIASYDSVALQLMCSIYVLLTHPEQTALLRAQPELMVHGVNELLRYVPLDAHVTFARYATEDVQVGDTLVRAGDAVLVSLPSANRDATVFERPDELDIHRPKRPDFAFGAGIHRCAGIPMAVLELRIALETLLRRLPAMRLAVPESELRWRPGMLLRSVETLPIVW